MYIFFMFPHSRDTPIFRVREHIKMYFKYSHISMFKSCIALLPSPRAASKGTYSLFLRLVNNLPQPKSTLLMLSATPSPLHKPAAKS